MIHRQETIVKETIETIKKDKKDTHTKDAPSCPCCQSNNVYGISRVVGYFSIIDNWNNSKQAELKRRQKGNYWTNGDETKDV